MSRIIFQFFLLFVSSIANCQDILNLPIKNGRIANPRPYADHLDKRVLIEPSNDFYVRSCFSGKIINIRNDDDGYTITVVKDSLIAFYSFVDSVLVKLQQFIEKGSIIGMKTMASSNEKFIVLSIYLGKIEVDPRNYIVYQNKQEATN